MTAEDISQVPAAISGCQDLVYKIPWDVQKREFLGLDAKFEFTTHFNFSFWKETHQMVLQIDTSIYIVDSIYTKPIDTMCIYYLLYIYLCQSAAPFDG